MTERYCIKPDFASAQRHLRAALDALATDPDDYDKAAVNLIWADVLDATLRLETMIGQAQAGGKD